MAPDANVCVKAGDSAAEYDSYLSVAVDAARAAGAIIGAAFSQPKNVEHKGAVDLVTETDKQAEALILEHIQRNFPTHK
jgi:fructose-1,6-bisphosphatase/inositol monophosphatase family enzyme